MNLAGKKVIIGITGGISAYKIPNLIRLLKKEEADVHVIMTKNAEEFVTKTTLQTLSQNNVLTDTFTNSSSVQHIDIIKNADLLIIAPATANTIAKINAGICDNLLTTTTLAASCPIFLVPAMNKNMWLNPITQENVKRLSSLGFNFIGPASGFQACGDEGIGRMVEIEDILSEINKFFNQSNILNGHKVVITAGPTVEPLDPVRYISNRSSGKMGYSLARVASKLGANVTLISGPTNLSNPENTKVIRIDTAQQMLDECEKNIDDCTLFIACAAVADFRAVKIEENKIKKKDDCNEMTINLTKNPDILKTISNSKKRPKIVVGFAAETTNIEEYAIKKLKSKNCDYIVANNVSKNAIGFNSDDNEVVIYSKNGTDQPIKIEKQKKELVAEKIIISCIQNVIKEK
jgi:phosphopantothenoylcysteine decarboxylase/phosphopantothenate--cysteine ligase